MSARMGLMDGDYPTPRRAQAVLRPPRCASCAATPEFEAVALTNRFRMVFSGNGPIEIEGKAYKDEARPARTPTSSRSPRGFFDVTGQKLLEGRDVHRRRPRHEAAGRHRQRRLRARSTSAPRAPIGRRFRTVDGNGTQAGPVAHHRRRRLDRPDARPVQQPERRRHRLLRAVLRHAVRAGLARDRSSASSPRSS